MNIKRVCQFLLDKEAGKPDAKLRYRIKWNRNKDIVAFNVGYRVDVDKWSVETQRCKNNTTHGKKKIAANIINKEIQKFEQIADEVFISFEKDNKNPSKEELRIRFNIKLGKIDNSTNLGNTFFNIYDDFMIKTATLKSWSVGTKKRYSVLKNKLYLHNRFFDIKTLSEDDLINFVKYMFAEQLHNTTIARKITDLRTFLRWAKKNKFYEGDLHDTFNIKLKGTELINEPIYLSWTELQHLYNIKIPETKKHIERVRDVFCFCAFSSLRYSDVLNLTRSDIKDDYIIIVTQKTVEGIKIELNKYTRAILEKYKNVVFENDRALPVISNQKMNDYVKELGEFAGFNEQKKVVYFVNNDRKEIVMPKYALLSSHCGRRTFIVNSLYIGIPAEVVMSWTGHSDYDSMKPYIKIVDELKKKSMSKFDEV
jgi:integrase